MMTQSRPRWSEQKDFNVFLRRSHRRPNANLPALSDLEVRNVLYLHKGTICRVLKYKSTPIFRYGGMASRDSNHDIEVSHVIHQRWHAIERDFGMRTPAADHIRVRRSSAESPRQIPAPCARPLIDNVIITKSLNNQVEYFGECPPHDQYLADRVVWMIRPQCALLLFRSPPLFALTRFDPHRIGCRHNGSSQRGR